MSDRKPTPHSGQYKPRMSGGGRCVMTFIELIITLMSEECCMSHIVSDERVEDILKEMTSWPPLLTNICTPTTTEPPKFLSANEGTHGFPTLKAHESSDKVQLKSQGGSSSSSDSDSSSDTESGKGSSPDEPAAPETLHMQPQNESDWQLGRWLERKENQHQQNPRSPCEVIKHNSHDSSERTVAEGTGVEISQHAEKASTHRPKHKRKKTTRHTEQKSTITDNNNKHTDRKVAHQPLLVKIELNLLSRIPREPKSAPSHASGHKRAAERDEKSSKKQKLDKEGKQSSSSQKSRHQSEVDRKGDTMMKKKKGTERRSSLSLEPHRDSGRKSHSSAAPEGQQKKSETHRKKTCKSHKELSEKPCPPAAKPRALLPPDLRKRSVEDHLKEAKKLKHKADATPDKMAKALRYLEAALSFVESAVAMETEPQTPKSAYTMFSETVDLIRFILKLKNYADPSAGALERDFCVLCMRCQSLLQMALFRYRRDSALKYSRTLTDHFKSSSRSASPSVSKSTAPSPSGGARVIPQPIQQVAASYVSITALFLNAHETWEQADEIALGGSGLLQELDSAVGPLSLTSSMSALVRYARHGLHWIRLDTQNPR
ncbi:uncharacterized protein aff1 [Garra rufa]|uniref:uncharacterized protein aff1 n=1 Tax=Garra rufa TaxID=137080 RepID=UPI003CCEEB03